ncbi:hypothetical protein FHX81_0408 [Saccharothrix saharensis]|uniref:RHIM domain-containing protein n=1 Tax=Saccharothrix saharensis TaxID=571190 RepID=A0A543J5M5_9PSEU|nr:hypothetical protein [Saccharothrix saharensis]TQM78155.1 hypothetical protein FHX81_0408 [Saccharothrix saharensis]
MIESVDLLVTALAAGAAAGLTDTASTAVKDAYLSLKAGVLGVLRRDGSVAGEVVRAVEDDAVATGGQAGELTAALHGVSADTDPELLAAARQLLELADPSGAGNGKYRVVVHGGQGVLVGDGNIQHNTFSQPR